MGVSDLCSRQFFYLLCGPKWLMLLLQRYFIWWYSQLISYDGNEPILELLPLIQLKIQTLEAAGLKQDSVDLSHLLWCCSAYWPLPTPLSLGGTAPENLSTSNRLESLCHRLSERPQTLPAVWDLKNCVILLKLHLESKNLVMKGRNK